MPLLQESVASVLPMTTIQMSVLLRSNLESMSILRLMMQTSIAGHHSSRGETLDREDGFQLLAVSVQEMMSLSLEEFMSGIQIHLLKLERWRKARCYCELGDSTSCESEQPGVNEHPEAYAANIYSNPPQQQRPDT
ncbi:hypothetical protein Fmac_024871 [Flemingia macrophylla]|uniref:Uncharacterized protein n=1 Tax=Flemingia macrophylla TaxID=520843 RepID=A0ABD1LQL0_9FABA